MNPSGNVNDEGKELMRMWQENALTPPFDPSQLARRIMAETSRFDRRVFWRNFREYAAGGIFIAAMLFLATVPKVRAVGVSGIAAAGFVMYYLWNSHRSAPQPDASADVQTYLTALLARYDHQIRLLRKVRYWYVLPLYSWMMFAAAHNPSPAARYVTFTIMTLFAVFIVWLNESYGVRKLREERRKAETLLRDQ